jgi:hypothetical protein
LQEYKPAKTLKAPKARNRASSAERRKYRECQECGRAKARGEIIASDKNQCHEVQIGRAHV